MFHGKPLQPKLFVQGMQGLGDNIYQRALIKQLARTREIWLETSWPEFYADLPLHVVRSQTRLRTQAKNIARSKARWEPRPPGAPMLRVSYINAFRTGRSIISGMEETLGVKLDAVDFDLPPLPASPVQSDKPIAFVRPVTVRREWLNEARNPDPQYLTLAVKVLRETHTIVTVADIDQHNECIVGTSPRADHEFIKGELAVMDMLALLAASDIVIGGVGFIIPASIALKRRCFVVLGGQAQHNAPDKILDRRLDCLSIGFATPRNFCQCSSMRHRCNKAIPDLMDQLCAFLNRSSIERRPVPCSGMPLALAISP